ncbi:MAG: 1-deoxy-D-xylulose-5-phosphate reductoisomerase [Spirochaetia bacterium]|jgi:1-deoxy-D-xylulose-5-phosphate reductoisomerase|nr:1-deoxy-D-xylulose-5-phosphate reductoisomerase [Spirochaetia bacterium]
MKRIIVIGATGSIGTQTLDVLHRHKDRFTLTGMSAHTNESSLLQTAANATKSGNPIPLCLSGAVPSDDRIQYFGTDGLDRLIRETEADIVVNAAAGAAGLEPSIAALESGKDLALANKESIVMAGRIVLDLAKGNGRRVLPVDSEHAAIFSMVERFGKNNIKEVLLTASGGAFRDLPIESLSKVSLADALSHPTWSMGAKITVDSASMANKGLEVIEAARLFGLASREIKVVIHPESRVHSFIRTRDGSLYAQVSKPDMRLPILTALAWPQMLDEDVADLDPAFFPMSFRPVDYGRYPLLTLAYDALDSGEGATVAYNAANEVAVEAFMDGRLRFIDLERILAPTLEKAWPVMLADITEVIEVDKAARIVAARKVQEIE